jgi:L-2-hydroxyglutarate oxidase LhgO
LCRTGKASLERFAEAHDIPFRQCGKLIIAIDEGELGRLAKLGERGRANGVEGLVEVGSERIRELEPHATGIRALWSPRTAIIDFGAVAAAYAAEIGDHGGKIMLGHRVTAIRPRGTWHILATSSQDVVTRKVISCAGLQSDRVAAMTGTRGGARIIPFRGDYYRLRPAARHLVRGLIYPVPDPSLPFLGVHFTARVNGDVWAGPNAVLALAPEGYQRWHINVADVAIVRFGGFWRMLRRHLHAGVAEGWRDVIKAAVVRQLQRYVPDIRGHQLIFGPSGVRAQLVGEDGRLVDDFHLDESAHVMHLRNAPSPPATACDALGTILAEKAIDRFGLP